MRPKGSGLIEEASEEGRVGVVGYGQSSASFSISIEFGRYGMCDRIDPGLNRPRSRGKVETEYRLCVGLIIGVSRNWVN